MRSDDEHGDGYLTEDELSKHERGTNMVAWGGGIAVSVFTVAMAAALVTRATDAWEYPAIIGLGAVPLAYAIFSNVIVRQAQIAIFQRYQGQLVMKVNRLEEAASRDELTGLHNRKHFYQAIQNELGKALAANEPLAIMLLDLDGLKSVNDQFGYATGDAVLNNLGKVIVEQIRGSDIAARIGGDEFGVVMPATDKRGAFSLAHRLWDELEQHPLYEEGEKRVKLTVSIGVSGYPWGGEDLEELLQWADADMYANKVSRRIPRESVTAEVRAHIDRLPDDFAGGF